MTKLRNDKHVAGHAAVYVQDARIDYYQGHPFTKAFYHVTGGFSKQN